jgi:putative NADH-flavin reductase
MRLIVFGATGLLGTRLIDEALARGHEVTGVARDVSELDPRDGRLDRFAADVTEPGSVAAVSAGCDVALSAVTQHTRPEMLIDAARSLLEGLELADVPRLVVAGGAGSLTVASGERLLDTPDFHHEWKPEALAHAAALDVYRQADTSVDWSYLSPAALLEPGERTGHYRVGGDQLLLDEHGRSRITMEDFAIAMLDEAEDPQHPRERFTVAH